MTEDYVSREEFENLKEKVIILEKELSESKKLLQNIDKKIDIISEKIITADKIDDLKFAPMEKRIKKLEDDQSWLWKTVAATIIGIAVKLIFDVSKIL